MSRKDEARADLMREVWKLTGVNMERAFPLHSIIGAIDAYGAACAEEGEQRGYERGRAELVDLFTAFDIFRESVKDVQDTGIRDEVGDASAHYRIYCDDAEWGDLCDAVERLRSRPQPKREETKG